MKTYTDISSDHWLLARLPLRFHPYARLMRLDRPIGTWLLLWPCWWSVVLVSDGLPNIWHLFLFALGALVMRGAGCVVNDIYDRHIDASVERTAGRPLPSGQVSLGQAVIFCAVLLMVGFVILCAFNAYTFWLGIASLLIVFTYPLAKRVTWWPQLILGLAFNLGALMGWSAAQGRLDIAALFLYVAGVFWTLAYDTIYAHQDKRDDAVVGIKSLALYLGDRSRFWIAGFFVASLTLISLAAFMSGVSVVFGFVIAAAYAHTVWQLATWDMNDPRNCLVRFRSNRDWGAIVFVALLMGKLL